MAEVGLLSDPHFLFFCLAKFCMQKFATHFFFLCDPSLTTVYSRLNRIASILNNYNVVIKVVVFYLPLNVGKGQGLIHFP